MEAPEKLYERLSCAYWPGDSSSHISPSGIYVSPSADRERGDAELDKLTLGEVAALLAYCGPPGRGGRGPTFCMIQERLRKLGWDVL